jgi:hypothetical protein
MALITGGILALRCHRVKLRDYLEDLHKNQVMCYRFVSAQAPVRRQNPGVASLSGTSTNCRTHQTALASVSIFSQSNDVGPLRGSGPDVATRCGPRASEVMGLQWKSWTGTTLVPHGTAFEGQFYPGRFKTRSSREPIGVPEQVRPIIEAWKKACADPSPDALMFPTFGRGERTGQAVPRWGKNFLRWRVRPIAQKLEIPDHLVTFQVMRRTLGTDLQEHGTLKDAQGALRHASIRTTGDV